MTDAMRAAVREVLAQLNAILKGEEPMPIALIFAKASPCVHGDGDDKMDASHTIHAESTENMESLLDYLEARVGEWQ